MIVLYDVILYEPLGHCSIKHVNVFVAWKDVIFQKSHNFPGNTNFKRLLFDVLEIIRKCSY